MHPRSWREEEVFQRTPYRQTESVLRRRRQGLRLPIPAWKANPRWPWTMRRTWTGAGRPRRREEWTRASDRARSICLARRSRGWRSGCPGSTIPRRQSRSPGDGPDGRSRSWIPESLWVYHAALSANWNGKLENEGRDFEVVPLRGQQNARI